jgi:hypothetical protein
MAFAKPLRMPIFGECLSSACRPPAPTGFTRSSMTGTPPRRARRRPRALITRGGYDWTRRYPWIVESALKNRIKRVVLDGEAVVLGVDGVSDFNALHSGRHNDEVQLCAFDVLAIDGDDLRRLLQNCDH